MIKPTLWQRLNDGSHPIKCQNSTFDIQDERWVKVLTGCKEKAMFRTKINNEEEQGTGEHGTEDLTEYKYYCVEHTYP